VRFYRIADSRHAPEGSEGARLHGGRWNSPGRAVIYACETQTGAMLEKLVHTNGRMPKHQVCVTFEAPDSLEITTLDVKAVKDWAAADMMSSRKAGDAWLEKAPAAVLRVPSVVFAVERNVLINPAHADFRRIKVVGTEPVRWDDRLFEETNARSKSGG
jgi:RES domain-containing protein